MIQALDFFASVTSERLPLTDANSRYPGVVSKTDVLLFLAGKPRSRG